MRRHHQQSATAKDEQIEHFNAAPDTGLTKDQAAQRTQAGLTNTAINTTFKTTRQIIYSNTFTFFNLIFVVLAVLLVMVRSFKDMTFLPVIIANTVIGIIQELRSKKVLEKLKESPDEAWTPTQTAREMELEPGEAETFARIYEKARYGKDDCSREEMERMLKIR